MNLGDLVGSLGTVLGDKLRLGRVGLSLPAQRVIGERQSLSPLSSVRLPLHFS